MRLLLRVSPSDIPRIGENGTAVLLDFRVLLFTLGISLFTGLFFGLVPAMAASRPNLAASLNEKSSRSGMSLRHGKVRSVLVISEMALALVLVIGATLLIRTFLKLEDVNPGFATHNVLVATMSLSGGRFQKTEPVAQIVRDGRERLVALPGVVDAGASNCLPLEGGFGMSFDVMGRPKGDAPFTGIAGFYSVSWSYFSTFEIPLLRGRAFTEQDNGAAPGVVLINEAMAQHFWSKGDPLKDRIHIGAGAGPAFAEAAPSGGWHRGEHTRWRPRSRSSPMMYIPLAQMPDAETALNSKVAPLWWIVRSRENPYTLVAH